MRFVLHDGLRHRLYVQYMNKCIFSFSSGFLFLLTEKRLIVDVKIKMIVDVKVKMIVDVNIKMTEPVMQCDELPNVSFSSH